MSDIIYDINQICILSRDFEGSQQNQISRIYVQWEARTDGWTEGQEKGNFRFPRLCERALKLFYVQSAYRVIRE